MGQAVVGDVDATGTDREAMRVGLLAGRAGDLDVELWSAADVGVVLGRGALVERESADQQEVGGGEVFYGARP
jgi:hypothetical protein